VATSPPREERGIAPERAGHSPEAGVDVGHWQNGAQNQHAEAPGLLQIHKTFSALGVPAYRLLWTSMLCGFLGMQMQMVARGLLAYEIGGTNSAIALVSLGWGLPMLCFSLIGGAVADRG
jgi:hypothetical protein